MPALSRDNQLQLSPSPNSATKNKDCRKLCFEIVQVGRRACMLMAEIRRHSGLVCKWKLATRIGLAPPLSIRERRALDPQEFQLRARRVLRYDRSASPQPKPDLAQRLAHRGEAGQVVGCLANIVEADD